MTRPSGLRARGAALWETLSAGLSVRDPRGLLLLEACRLADRLDALEVELAGGVDVRLLSEARQGQLALSTLLDRLGVDLTRSTERAASELDSLSARRAARATSP